ncbi:MAG: hypothetical protein ABL917_00255 [Parcubacteria group bacterium]
MADEKKPEAKDSKPAGVTTDPLTEMIAFFIVIFLILSFLNGLFNYVNGGKLFSFNWKAPTERNIWLSLSKPISSVLNPIGGKFVVTSKTAPLYDSPGGKQISSFKVGSKGTIIGGPVTIYGEKYWEVTFEDGSTGWVSEKDIAYMKDEEPGFFAKIFLLFWKLTSYVKVISIILCIILFIFIVYVSRKLAKIRNEERLRLYPGGFMTGTPQVEIAKNPNWERILKYVDSLTESDWRLAILEADIILYDLLEIMNLPGDTVGDKLKSVEKSDFLTLDNAWEAHRVRNQVAHEGQSFVLTQHEARRIIELYRTVFEEFKVI